MHINSHKTFCDIWGGGVNPLYTLSCMVYTCDYNFAPTSIDGDLEGIDSVLIGQLRRRQQAQQEDPPGP